jgi:hypothetical protein
MSERTAHTKPAETTEDSRTRAADSDSATRPRRRPLPLRIFISHKLTDSDRAEILAQALRDHAGTGLRVFTPPSIQAGVDWSETVHTALGKSHWLLLLYTDPEQAWDWCLYETGFFAAREDPDRRIICLHRVGNPPPNPFRRWKSVEATVPKVTQLLLMQIYGSADGGWGVAPDFAANTVGMRRLAERIVAAVGPTATEERLFTSNMSVRINATETDQVESGQIPDTALIECDPRALAILGATTLAGPLTWKKLTRNAHPPLKRWLNYLAQVPKRSTWPGFVPKLPLLRGSEIDRGYRSVLTRIETLPKQWMRLHITFVEVHAATERDPHDPLDRLYHLITLFRLVERGWVRRYARDLAGLADAPNSDDEKRLLIEEVRAEHEHIIIEAQNRGIEFLVDATSVFEEPDRSRLAQLVREDYRAAYDRLRNARDIPATQAAMNQIHDVCREFREAACRRYAALVQNAAPNR